MFTEDYADVFAGDERWRSLSTPEGDVFEWDPESTYVRKPPYFDGMQREPAPVEDITGARVLAKLGDSVTTDHISPAGAIKKDSPAGRYLAEHGVEQRDFNSYGSRRGNHEVMIRGTFANIRLRNQLAPGTEGGYTKVFLDGGGDGGDGDHDLRRRSGICRGRAPLLILAGKEYGSGSSRDWAAKGTTLLGVRAVIAESYERIHRSNLIGMGVLPLQYSDGENAESLGLSGNETFNIVGAVELNDGRTPKTVKVKAARVTMWSSSTRGSGSTPPARPATTATAASCPTCCGTCWPAERRCRTCGSWPCWSSRWSSAPRCRAWWAWGSVWWRLRSRA